MVCVYYLWPLVENGSRKREGGGALTSQVCGWEDQLQRSSEVLYTSSALLSRVVPCVIGVHGPTCDHGLSRVGCIHMMIYR